MSSPYRVKGRETQTRSVEVEVYSDEILKIIQNKIIDIYGLNLPRHVPLDEVRVLNGAFVYDCPHTRYLDDEICGVYTKEVEDQILTYKSVKTLLNKKRSKPPGEE